MKRNPANYQAIVMVTMQTAPQFYHQHRYQIPITEDFELLGITLDEKLKFETRVARVCRGVSRQVAQVYGKDASL